jgi:SET domain-containing protein
MLLIKVKLEVSKINGTGLFADQFIPKGTLIWKFQPGFDIKIDRNELEELPKVAREAFLKYAYLSVTSNKYVLCFDNARFFNHSDTPNCVEQASPDGEEEGITVTARDILSGEELISNYRIFDADFDYKMSLSGLHLCGKERVADYN